MYYNSARHSELKKVQTMQPSWLGRCAMSMNDNTEHHVIRVEYQLYRKKKKKSPERQLSYVELNLLQLIITAAIQN